jgi:hypothetical protein
MKLLVILGTCWYQRWKHQKLNCKQLEDIDLGIVIIGVHCIIVLAAHGGKGYKHSPMTLDCTTVNMGNAPLSSSQLRPLNIHMHS